MAKARRTRSHDRSVFLCALLAGLPAIGIALALLWGEEHAAPLRWGLSLAAVAAWLGFAAAARARVVRPLQTMANMLLAVREGDYSFRARGARHDDPLGEVMAEINALGSLLQAQRRGAMEAAALLTKVMEEIDVAVFAFDENRILRLANRAGARLLARPHDALLGRSAEALGLSECLEGDPERLLASSLPGASGRWGLRRTQFREEGRPHQLVVIADLSQALRREELEAWRRLVRVLGHELNNSLAPIKSIAGSLGAGLRRNFRPADWEDDLRSGLDIISSRADGLGRFLQAYSRLARLPAPTLAECDLAALARRAAALEVRLPISVGDGAAAPLRCDPAQIEQALINLIKNAADAALEQRAAGRGDANVRVTWSRSGRDFEIRIEDDGPGLPETTNLFVPFFTTKPEGTGIGLVLCRQIAENHGGSLELRNRQDAAGCLAVLSLPVTSSQRP